MIGATTDYGLLLLSRYDEHTPAMPARAAMRTAGQASWAPITASAASANLGASLTWLPSEPGGPRIPPHDGPEAAESDGCWDRKHPKYDHHPDGRP
ncbi:MMPL family transporter [Streptomyces sp. NPDC002688]|uniref:MMPL family transporter n=1 Tax=Streptomyces sp. NPDC002688 TaxID=3154423 RepID=UPI00331BABBA